MAAKRKRAPRRVPKDVLRLAQRIADIALGNRDRVDVEHDAERCHICQRIGRLIVNYKSAAQE